MVDFSWKPKMKFHCPECGAYGKHLVSKEFSGEYINKAHHIKCSKCGDKSVVSQEYLIELLGGKKDEN